VRPCHPVRGQTARLGTARLLLCAHSTGLRDSKHVPTRPAVPGEAGGPGAARRAGSSYAAMSAPRLRHVPTMACACFGPRSGWQHSAAYLHMSAQGCTGRLARRTQGSMAGQPPPLKKEPIVHAVVHARDFPDCAECKQGALPLSKSPPARRASRLLPSTQPSLPLRTRTRASARRAAGRAAACRELPRPPPCRCQSSQGRHPARTRGARRVTWCLPQKTPQSELRALPPASMLASS